MKKIIAILGIFSLMNCQKEALSETETGLNLMEISERELSQKIDFQDNDTIYITNFFATWCQPCMHEIPYFKEKMEETKGEKIKFTFVNIDNPKIWDTKIVEFAQQSGLGKNIVLFNHRQASTEFYSQNFSAWDGSAIPFTIISKGKEKHEIMGMMRKEDLHQRINALK